MRRICLRRFSSQILLFALGAMAALAQTTAGLNGSITDATAAGIPDAKVLVINTGTGAQREGVSDAAGWYDVRLLQPGSYRITVQKSRLRQLTRENPTPEVKQIARTACVMELW